MNGLFCCVEDVLEKCEDLSYDLYSEEAGSVICCLSKSISFKYTS